MHTRLGQALEDKKLSEAEAKTYEVVDTFWKQVWRMGKDKGQSDHKSKIISKVFASSEKHSAKKGPLTIISGVTTCATCGKKSKTWRQLKEHVLVKHLAGKLLDHFSFNSDQKTYSCEFGQECNVQRKKKCDMMNHLHCKHHVVTEEQVLEIATEPKELGQTQDASEEQRGSMALATFPETVAAMNRQACEVKIFNILEGVEYPSDVSDISNYNKLQSTRHQLASSFEAGGVEKEGFVPRCRERSPSRGSKKEKKSSKEKREVGKSAVQLPDLFACPLLMKSQSPGSSFTASSSSTNQANVSELSSTKSMQKNIIDINIKPQADEEQPWKDGCGSDEDTADGVYTCRWCLFKYNEDKCLKEHLAKEHFHLFKEVIL